MAITTADTIVNDQTLTTPLFERECIACPPDASTDSSRTEFNAGAIEADRFIAVNGWGNGFNVANLLGDRKESCLNVAHAGHRLSAADFP
jgi:hypothetical protein